MVQYLTFDELREANFLRDKDIFHHLGKWPEPYWGNAIAGEVGEMCNLIKKKNRQQDPSDADATAEKIGDEMADVIIYIDILAQQMGLNLADCIRKKFNQKSEELGSYVRL